MTFPETSEHNDEGRSAKRGSVWHGAMAAARFVLPFGGRPGARRMDDAARIGPWLVPIGVLTGVAWAGLFKGTWRLYGEIANLRLIPALAVVLLECLLTGPFLALGLARTAHLLTSARPLRSESDRAAPLSPVGTLALVLTVLSQWALIASIPVVTGWWPTEDWRYYLRHFYPAPVYRSLVLAPIWGRWAMMMGATIGKTARDADEGTMALCRSVTPTTLALQSVVPFVLSAIYLSRDGNYLTGIIVGLLVFLAVYLVCMVMARRGGGQSRQSLYAAGQIGQLAFLALYRAFWPLIHG